MAKSESQREAIRMLGLCGVRPGAEFHHLSAYQHADLAKLAAQVVYRPREAQLKACSATQLFHDLLQRKALNPNFGNADEGTDNKGAAGTDNEVPGATDLECEREELQVALEMAEEEFDLKPTNEAYAEVLDCAQDLAEFDRAGIVD